MRISRGIVCAVLGAAVLSYLAIVTLIALPPEGPPRWFAVGGIAGLSLIVGVLVNGISMQDFRKVSRDHQEASNRYDTLTSRLSPLLYRGIEDALHRRKEAFNPKADLIFNVSAPINGFYRQVGSTLPAGHPLRGYEAKVDEGYRAFFHDRKVAGYLRTSWSQPNVEGNRSVFDRAGNLLGEVPTSPMTDRWRMPVESKWLYCRPIFEESTATPWSNRVVGILTVLSSIDDSESLFKSAEFQQIVDSIATEVSPYLVAIQVLLGEEKP